MPRRQSMRTCTGCGRNRPREEMMRIVADPGGRALLDAKRRLPGRGAYFCPRRECIESASRGRLAAVLKVKDLSGGDPRSLTSAVASAQRSRVSSLLGLAQKRGLTISGASLVEGELRGEGCTEGMLLVAEDASADVVAKAVRRARVAGLPVERFLTREEIGHAVGKSLRSAVLVKDGGLSRMIGEAAKICRAVLPGDDREEKHHG